ncbi:acyltransferase family protein [Bacillus pseudomycoides]|uniref:acyltransferase family protein n=1 Tax=Bacillus pseudomycoides TaxID=64104 RepID=UPI000BEE76D5|nr:acyltransferase [Bacillus pseudomycoides]PEB41236.1 acyltransferase [Bacillus pseudomycoides]PGD90041.1 acyltransferase [Bacillus pseudomycoides]PGD95365.1 acyltransferase [Bacillus pseudomycoides]PHE66692.1 acyltransferase [Bacillus pseudomycoides]PHG16854.1 acyltransferase [Bacillus pseudomycoides]
MMKRYEEFDSLRGLAALLVIIGHHMMLLPAYENYQYELNSPFIIYLFKETPLRLFFSSGNESVILFFVLSGFVLYLSINNEKFHYDTYIIKRICRIYIPYLVAISISIIAKMLFSRNDMPFISDWFSKSWITADTPALLLQHLVFIGEYNTDAYNNVIWSLVHEMRISIIFPFLTFFFIRKRLRYSLLWFIVLSFSSTMGLYLFNPSGSITSSFLSFHYITLFFMGALLAKYRYFIFHYVLNMNKMMKIALLLIAIICFMYEGIIGEVDFLNNYVLRNYVVSFGVCMVMIMSISSWTFSALLRRKVFVFLGKISYSLYLYHLVSLFSVMYLFYDKLPTILIVFLSFSLSFLLSSLGYLFIEKPCINLGRYLTRRWRNIFWKEIKIRDRIS